MHVAKVLLHKETVCETCEGPEHEVAACFPSEDRLSHNTHYNPIITWREASKRARQNGRAGIHNFCPGAAQRHEPSKCMFEDGRPTARKAE
jgi:hypothetical protein